MSNKLNEVMQKSRALYEVEKEKFLNALAEFIEANRAKVTSSDEYRFAMKVRYVGLGKISNFECTYSFGVTPKDLQEPFQIGIAENSVVKILEEEYHASLNDQILDKKTGELYTNVIIPFI